MDLGWALGILPDPKTYGGIVIRRSPAKGDRMFRQYSLFFLPSILAHFSL